MYFKNKKISKAYYPKQEMCDKKFTESKGIIGSKNYPIYDKNTVCKAEIVTDADKIIKAYIIDMQIDPA